MFTLIILWWSCGWRAIYRNSDFRLAPCGIRTDRHRATQNSFSSKRTLTLRRRWRRASRTARGPSCGGSHCKGFRYVTEPSTPACSGLHNVKCGRPCTCAAAFKDVKIARNAFLPKGWMKIATWTAFVRRVTGWVCQKIAQHKLMHNFYRG
jgi:hypothetical protein